MLRATKTLHHANVAGRFAGVRMTGNLTDWGAVVAQKNELVGALRKSKYLDLLPEYSGIDYREGRAVFTADGLAIDGQALAAEKIIIATRSQLQPDGEPEISDAMPAVVFTDPQVAAVGLTEAAAVAEAITW